MPLPKAKSNSLFSNSFFIFVVRFFPALANLLVIIWYSNHLTATQYGNYQHFWIQLQVFIPLACFGIHVLTVTYTGSYLVGLMKRIAPLYIVLYGLWVAILGSVFAAMQYHALGIAPAVSLLFLVSYALSFTLESVLIVFRNFTTLIITNVFYAAAYCAIHWYILHHGFSIVTVFTWLLAITLLRFLVYSVVITIDAKKVTDEHNAVYDIKKIRSLWLHLGVFDIVQLLSTYIDKFIISIVLTASLSAIYYTGSQNIPFLPMLLSVAGTAVLIQAAGSNENNNLVAMMNQVGRILSSIVFPVFFFLLFFRYEFITTIFTDRYAPAVPVFLAAILVLPLRAYSFNTLLQKMHMGSVINIGAISELLLACALMYPLYRWMGLPGVALSFVITTYLQAWFYLYHAGKSLQVSPLKLLPLRNWITKLIVFFFLFITIHYVAGRYFTGKIPLLLGGCLTIVTIAIALVIELKKGKNVQPEQTKIT